MRGPCPYPRGHDPAYWRKYLVGREMSPGPWSAVSHGFPGLVDVHSLEGTVVSRSTLNLKPLTFVTTLSYRFRTYATTVSALKKDVVCGSNLASNHHSPLHSSSWLALWLPSAAHRLLKWVGHSIYSMLDSIYQREGHIPYHICTLQTGRT